MANISDAYGTIEIKGKKIEDIATFIVLEYINNEQRYYSTDISYDVDISNALYKNYRLFIESKLLLKEFIHKLTPIIKKHFEKEDDEFIGDFNFIASGRWIFENNLEWFFDWSQGLINIKLDNQDLTKPIDAFQSNFEKNKTTLKEIIEHFSKKDNPPVTLQFAYKDMEFGCEVFYESNAIVTPKKESDKSLTTHVETFGEIQYGPNYLELKEFDDELNIFDASWYALKELLNTEYKEQWIKFLTSDQVESPEKLYDQLVKIQKTKSNNFLSNEKLDELFTKIFNEQDNSAAILLIGYDAETLENIKYELKEYDMFNDYLKTLQQFVKSIKGGDIDA